MKIGFDAVCDLRDAADRDWPSCSDQRIFFQRDDAAAVPRRILLQRCFDHRAVGVVRQQRGERRLPREAEYSTMRRRRSPAGSSGDRRRAMRRWHRSKMRSPECCGARDLADRADRLGKQRPEDHLGAFIDRLLRRGLRGLRRAGVVFDQELDIRVLEFVERHFGGILHRLRGDAGVAGRRQRQDQRDTNLPRAERGRRRRFARLLHLTRSEPIADIGAGRESGSSDNNAEDGAPTRQDPPLVRYPAHDLTRASPRQQS